LLLGDDMDRAPVFIADILGESLAVISHNSS
jgi:hypothetical protein